MIVNIEIFSSQGVPLNLAIMNLADKVANECSRVQNCWIHILARISIRLILDIVNTVTN